MSGCVSVPYVEFPASTAYVDCSLNPGSPACEPGELAHALNDVDYTKELFRQKLIHEFKRKRRFSAATIFLATATVGLAAYDAHVDTVLGAAIAGSLVYALGTWNTSQDRLLIYVEGMKAMDCIRSSVAPLNRGPGYDADLRAAAAKLLQVHEKAAAALGNMRGAYASVTGLEQELDAAIRAEVLATETALEQSRALLQRSNALQTKLKEVPARVNATFHTVHTSIDDALRGTLADLSTLRSHLQSLNGFVQIFAPGVDLDAAVQGVLVSGGVTGEPRTAQAEDAVTRASGVPAAYGELTATRHILLAAVSMLKGLVDQVDAAAAGLNLDGCGVDASKLTSSISLDRTTIQLTEGKAQTSFVRITGGTTPYVAALVDLPADGINVTMLAGTNQIVVTATDETKAGSTYRVSVADSASPQRVATLTISVVAPASESPSRIGAPEDYPCRVVETLGWSGDEVCLVQRVAGGVKVDRKFGKDTCAAVLAQWDKRLDFDTGTKPVGDMSRAQAESLLAQAKKVAGLDADAEATEIAAVCGSSSDPVGSTPAPEPAADADCELPGANEDNELECGMSAGDMKHVRELLNQRLGLSLDTEATAFDTALRDAIKRFQGEAGVLSEGDANFGFLTAPTMHILESGQ